PSDAKVTYQQDISRAGIKLNRIIKTMKYSNNRLNIVVLDACRNNPLPKKPNSRSVSTGGWKEITELAEGMFIGYGTSKGREAADGNGRNGLFTKHLIHNIQQPGLTIERVFKNTRIAVNKESIKLGKPQLPTDQNQLLGDFYFIPPKDNTIIARVKPDDSNKIQTVSTSTKPINNISSRISQPQIDVLKPDTEGTVIDKERNLMWMRCSLGQTWNNRRRKCSGHATKHTFDEAQAQAENSSYAGYKDWRVPTIEELVTLVYCSTGKPKIDRRGRLDGCPSVGLLEPVMDLDEFPDTPISFFRSASPNANNSSYAWTVYFGSGNTYNLGGRSNLEHVRLVRFGQ
ncbi:MAG: DUF1566 domain-containing protein, partial [Alcanivoracaceae bacterium]|nr:DUF1566 domain-containing protein [Alcanivoracaceae bacterium]